ncbi:unnamed protein product [Eruca vesicaria subsp. sativa]|uniref:Uncharacterized protein n=1 Tax=Eruca vesicaria subsp. sativa TaxID=29727 RepID=A0ABC8JRT4_ERUVS|nr:unnamed protein product [Eruca vesicaria subsp. sativa]
MKSVYSLLKVASGEPPSQLRMWKAEDGASLMFQLPVPARTPVVKELCGLDIVESYIPS